MLAIEQIKDFPKQEKFLVKYFNQQLKAYKETDNTLFILAKGRRNRGYRVTANLDNVFNHVELVKLPQPEDKNTKWQKSLKRAVKLMEESGLWSNIKEVYENLLKYNITLEEKEKIYDLDWEDKDKAIKYCREKGYNFMINEEAGRIKTDYIWEISRCQLKSMYFGKRDNKEYKKIIKQAIKNKQKYSIPHITVNYDVSFEYNPEINKAWYSEEYRGCGNGHYYLALNHSTALFCEND